jgi:phage tail tape-measure protein
MASNPTPKEDKARQLGHTAAESAGVHPVGTAIGAVLGAIVGALCGIAAGPVGSLFGAVAGAVAGGVLASFRGTPPARRP